MASQGYILTGAKRVTAFALARPKTFIALFCLVLYLPGLTTLPPLDRDESRFAQATKQMIETGNMVEIMFQDQPRNKKPVGIYWMQAGPAALFAGEDLNRIWPYRLPSLLGALLAALGTFFLGRHAFNKETGVLAGSMMAGAILLVGEANIAKTDAMLLASTVWCQLILYMAFLASHRNEKIDLIPALTFWVVLGIGILIKGPVVPMVLALTIIAVGIWDRRFKWLLQLKPLVGPLIALAIVLPWGIAVWLATNGQFFAEAVGQDFAPKLLSGQESHGAPPGYYLLLVSVTFWPASLFMWPALIGAFRNRGNLEFKFLLAWVIPNWLVFELVPTKLPHYILHIYPALALITAWAILASIKSATPLANSLVGKTSVGVWMIVGLLFATLLTFLPIEYGAGLVPALLTASIVIAALVVWISVWAWRGKTVYAALGAIFTGALFGFFLLEGTARSIPDINVSPRLAAALATIDQSGDRQLASTGYAEPSLVFLAGTNTLLASPKDVATFLANNPNALVLVEQRQLEAFLSEMRDRNIGVTALKSVSGLNYSRGDDVTLTMFEQTSELESEGVE